MRWVSSLKGSGAHVLRTEIAVLLHLLLHAAEGWGGGTSRMRQSIDLGAVAREITFAPTASLRNPTPRHAMVRPTHRGQQPRPDEDESRPMSGAGRMRYQSKILTLILILCARPKAHGAGPWPLSQPVSLGAAQIRAAGSSFHLPARSRRRSPRRPSRHHRAPVVRADRRGIRQYPAEQLRRAARI